MTNTTRSISDRLKELPFFASVLSTDEIGQISPLTQAVMFRPNEIIAEEGTPAESLFVIEKGRVSIEIHASPWGIRPMATLGAGEVFGWSWAFPPFVWHFDCRATTETYVLEIDGFKLRSLMEDNPKIGFAIMKQLAQIFTERLKATRLQLMDVYL